MEVTAQLILTVILYAARPANDLDMMRRAIDDVVDSGLGVSQLPDSIELVLDGQKSNYSWMMEDAITHKLLERHVRVVRSSDAKLHYRIVDMRISYTPFRKWILGPRLAVRNFYIDATFKLVEGNEVKWIRTFEIMRSDTVPIRLLMELRHEGLSPPLPESRTIIEPIIAVIGIGYVLFYLYSGGH